MNTFSKISYLSVTAILLITSCNSDSKQSQAEEPKKNIDTIHTAQIADSIVATIKTNDIGNLPQVLKQTSAKVAKLQDEQSKCTDIEKMFTYDSIIASAKIQAKKSIIASYKALHQPCTLYFSQTQNLDKIKITELKVTGADFNELQLEATVQALKNSAYNMPFTSISASDSLGKRLDISGGIGLESTKLQAGKTYTFKGKIANAQNLKKGFKILFDEDIKKW